MKLIISSAGGCRYYATPDDSTAPAYTIPKGTEVLLYDSHEIDPIDPAPYGCVCYPEYTEGLAI